MATAKPPFALTSDGPTNPGWDQTMEPQQYPVAEIKARDIADEAAPAPGDVTEDEFVDEG